MRRHVLLLGAVIVQGFTAYLVQGCSGDDTTSTTTPDASSHDSSTDSTGDVSMPDASPDVTPDATPDSAPDVHDAGCPSAWTLTPVVDTSITQPGDAGPLFLHAGAVGTQDYQCLATVVDGGTTYAWTFVGPEAELRDCNATRIGAHFASDGGATRPEWMEIAGDYVIGKKHSAYTPDGGAGSIPWLLIDTVSTGGTGPRPGGV